MRRAEERLRRRGSNGGNMPPIQWFLLLWTWHFEGREDGACGELFDFLVAGDGGGAFPGGIPPDGVFARVTL